MSKVQRRKLLRNAGGVAAAATASLAAPAIAQSRIEWRLVTAFPKMMPGAGVGAERFAKNVADATEGRLIIKVYAAGEIVPAYEAFEAVSRGTADGLAGASYYWQNKSKIFSLFTSVPFGMASHEFQAWMIHGGGQQLWDESYKAFGLKPFHSGTTGVQMAGWYNKEIKSVADVNGIKFRMPGFGGEALRKLGATIVNLPGGEIFGALQAGTIDGTEWVGPWQDLAMGFYKVTKYFYWPGMHEPQTTGELSFNLSKFTALPKSMQLAVEWAVGNEYHIQSAEFDAEHAAALETLIKVHKVQLRRLPDDFLKAFGEAWNEVRKELYDGGDALTKKTLDSYYKFLPQVMAVTRIGLQEYLNGRLIGLKL